MAAETLTATRVGLPVTAFFGAGVLQVAWGTIAVGAAVEADDIFEMCKVPAGATVIGGYLHMEDLDTGGEAIDVSVGWAANGSDAADPNGLLLAGVKTGDISVHLDVASTFMPFGGVLLSAGPKTLARDTILQVTVIAAATTFAAGQMTLVAYYTVA
jgi:hypothetical protein